MRPPVTTGGICRPTRGGPRKRPRRCFNEAAGYYRRNPGLSIGFRVRRGFRSSFNEAAGYYRRNRRRRSTQTRRACPASMRPPVTTGGIARPAGAAYPVADLASMRPPVTTGGILLGALDVALGESVASMRPPVTTGGIRHVPPSRLRMPGASMRPPVTTGGIFRCPNCSHLRRTCSFNEAAGYYRRNPEGRYGARRRSLQEASMRPPVTTGGILFAGVLVHPGRKASMRPPVTTGGIAAAPRKHLLHLL